MCSSDLGILPQHLRHPVAGVALGNAAQIHGAATVQGHGIAIHMDMTTPNQRQQRINFTLGWDPGAVRGDAPQGHQGRHRHIEQAARRGAVGHGALEQRRRFLADHGAAAVIQFVNIAGRNRPGKRLLQAVYFSG